MTWLIAEMWIYLAATAIFALLLGWLLFGFSGRRARRAEQNQLEVERSTSRRRVADLEKRVQQLEPAASRVPALEGQSRQLREENDRLMASQTHLEDVEASARAVPELERQLAASESNNQDLMVRLEAIDHLEQANTELQSESDRLSRELSMRGSRIAELEKDLETVRAERLTLRSRLTQVENEAAAVQADDHPIDLRPVGTTSPGAVGESTSPANNDRRSGLEQRMPLAAAGTTQTIASPRNGSDEDFRRQLAARDRRIETLEARLESADQLEARVAELEARTPSNAVVTPPVGRTPVTDIRPPIPERPSTEPVAHRSSATRDDLTAIVGIGPRLAGLLNNAGITRFDQLAALTDEEIPLLEKQIRERPGRVQRDDWRGQARRLLTAGGATR